MKLPNRHILISQYKHRPYIHTKTLSKRVFFSIFNLISGNFHTQKNKNTAKRFNQIKEITEYIGWLINKFVIEKKIIIGAETFLPNLKK